MNDDILRKFWEMEELPKRETVSIEEQSITSRKHITVVMMADSK